MVRQRNDRTAEQWDFEYMYMNSNETRRAIQQQTVRHLTLQLHGKAHDTQGMRHLFFKITPEQWMEVGRFLIHSVVGDVKRNIKGTVGNGNAGTAGNGEQGTAGDDDQNTTGDCTGNRNQDTTAHDDQGTAGHGDQVTARHGTKALGLMLTHQGVKRQSTVIRDPMTRMQECVVWSFRARRTQRQRALLCQLQL